MGIHDLWLFVAAGLLLNVTPGPDMALIIARSGRGGAHAGVAVAFGVSAGSFVHIAAAALGISAIVMASAGVFTAVKWAGALYLLYLGLHMIWMAGTPPTPDKFNEIASTNGWGAFRQGFLTNVLNPKVAIFFLAFLPQFIDADAPSRVAAFVLLGLLFNLTGTLWNIGVALAAARLGSAVGVGGLKPWLERSIGVAFVGVAFKIAASERP